MLTDTIAAIATAPGPSGIGIVRVSGPESLRVADRLFVHPQPENRPRPSDHPGGVFMHGFIRRVDGELEDSVPVDEVILLVYRAPRSYTREDAIEIQTHGGRLSSQRILRQVLACGVRLSEPGEFTRRAFLNGRIDLTQAEAVMDLISAECDRAAASAILQLRGDIRRSLENIYSTILDSMSSFEASLDFREDGIPETLIGDGAEKLVEAIQVAERLADTWQEGRVLREGTRVVIAGRPNVGKSTLINAILGVERAIVSDAPGTTRDTIEETLVIAGFPVRIVDTAGLREPSCIVEVQGVQRARTAVGAADIILYVMDGSKPLSLEDTGNLDQIQRRPGSGRSPEVLVVLNKRDLGEAVVPDQLTPLRCIRCSLLEPEGASPVKRELEAVLSAVADGPPHAVVCERHYRGLRVAIDHLHAAARLMGKNSSRGGAAVDPEEAPVLAAVHLRTALDEIGQLLGRTYTADLLDRVFARFCIGK